MTGMGNVYKLLLAVVSVSIMVGSSPKETPITDADREAVLAYSETKTDNLLAGMNANDYAMLSKDFDQQMSNAMTQSEFDKLKKDRDEGGVGGAHARVERGAAPVSR